MLLFYYTVCESVRHVSMASSCLLLQNIEGVGKDLTKIEYITFDTLLGTCEIFRSYTVHWV